LGRPKRKTDDGFDVSESAGGRRLRLATERVRVTGRNERPTVVWKATVGALVGGTSISAASVPRALTSTVRRLQL
jgi:hypothetical protein